MSVPLAEIRDEAFAVVLGARRGTNLSWATVQVERRTERSAPLIALLWHTGQDITYEDERRTRTLASRALRTPEALADLLLALNGGQSALARGGWGENPLAHRALIAALATVAVSYVERRQPELDRLLEDLRLRECCTGLTVKRLPSAIATAARKRFINAAEFQVAAGLLDADWIVAQTESEFEAAVVLTVGRLLYRRRSHGASDTEFPRGVRTGVAELLGVPVPTETRCRQAVSAWLSSRPVLRASAARAALDA